MSDPGGGDGPPDEGADDRDGWDALEAEGDQAPGGRPVNRRHVLGGLVLLSAAAGAGVVLTGDSDDGGTDGGPDGTPTPYGYGGPPTPTDDRGGPLADETPVRTTDPDTGDGGSGGTTTPTSTPESTPEPTTAPPTTAPPTTAPSTTAPPTTAPPTSTINDDYGYQGYGEYGYGGVGP